MVIGQDRSATQPEYGVRDLRLAQFGIRLAEALRFPILTVIDTPGAELSAEAERQGIVREIADTLGAMEARTVPAVGLLLGEGCGAAAIATLGTDIVLAAEHSWLAALPLRGAADIMYGDPNRTLDVAVAQQITATQLWAEGIVDRLIPEPLSELPSEWCARVVAACAAAVRPAMAC